MSRTRNILKPWLPTRTARTAGPAPRRVFLALVIAGVLSTGCGSRSETARSLRDWNVLLVTLDTTRQDHLGCYGARQARTPVLDGLAADGTRFDRAVAQAPITLPAHASILTGRVPPAHGARGNGIYSVPPSETTLAEILSRSGYATAAVVAATVLDRKHGLEQGFDAYDDDPDEMQGGLGITDPSRTGPVVTAAALRRIDEFPTAKPWFLWVHYFDPHTPYTPPEPFRSEFENSREGRYAAEIATMDAALGDLLRGLRQRGLDDRLLVVAIGDHGEGVTGPHEEKTHGLLLYEDTLRVPLIVHAEGGLPRGAVDDGLARQIDILPTVVDLLELPIPDSVEGSSLASRLRPSKVGTPSDSPARTGSAPVREAAPESNEEVPADGDDPASYAETFLGYDAYGWSPLFQLRTRDWKYVQGSRHELYDLRLDPDEQRDVADDHPERVREMADRLAEIRGSADFSGGVFHKTLTADAAEAEPVTTRRSDGWS